MRRFRGFSRPGSPTRILTPPIKTKTYTKFSTQIPVFVDEKTLEPLLAQNGVQITAQPLETPRSGLLNFLLAFGPTVLLIVGFIWLTRRAAASAGGGVFGMGRSRAKRYDATAVETPITFEDVAGIDEVESELVEVVDFLKNPDQVLAPRWDDAERCPADRLRQAPARRCWRVRPPARQACRSSRCPAPSSSR